jgi:hypothetical protein
MLDFSMRESFGRKIRQDPWEEQGIPTKSRIKEAIESGDKGLAKELIDYMWRFETIRLHDLYQHWIWGLQTYIAEKYGEEEVYHSMRRQAETWNVKPAIEKTAALSVEDYVLAKAENMRSHPNGPGEYGDYELVEEQDRYVMTFRPCGSGGRMRIHCENGNLPPRTEPPFNFGVTKKPYPWSWGKTGVPYYCVHCGICNEIIPIEMIGYPLRVNDYREDVTDGSCAWFFYKEPELIPEEYFTRVGMVKDPSKFKKWPKKKA